MATEVVMSTAWEQLEGATLSLARSGAIKDRLAEAYRKHLALVDAQDLPEGLRADFRACHEALTREHPLRGEDAVRATVRKMSNQEADEIACTVVRMFAAFMHEAQLASALAAAEIAHNGAAGTAARGKSLKSVPQVISLYAAPDPTMPDLAEGTARSALSPAQSSLNSMVSQRAVSS
jgi:hypothetical protein